MRKILLVGSQHGNELLGDRLIRRIKRHHPDLLDKVDFCLANPKAQRAKTRFVESDMNRSFARGLHTYEARRAAKLLAHITEGNYSLVLDLHTTTDKMEPCFIVTKTQSSSVNNFLKVSHINKVVVMEHEIIATSLIGNAGNTISIEAPVHMMDSKFLEQLVESLRAYQQSRIPDQCEKEFYYVDMLIQKEVFTPRQFNSMKNFELFEESFYPILIRSSSYKKYKKYRGFGATVKLNKMIY